MSTKKLLFGAFMVLMLMLAFPSYGAASNCSPTLCRLRYDLAAEVHTLRNYKNCNDVYSLDCICNRTIDIQFIEHPPYIYTDASTGNVTGLLTGMKSFNFSEQLRGK